MKICKGIVLSNDSVGEKYYHLRIHCPEIAREVKRGRSSMSAVQKGSIRF